MKLLRLSVLAAGLLTGSLAFAKDISSPADWNAFIMAANGGDWSAWKDENGVVNIIADLEFPKAAACLESANTWTGILDGHGHTITQKAARLPLMINIGPEGVVRNLTVAGSRRSHLRNGWASSIAVNNAGLVENCRSEVEYVVSGSHANVHGLVRTNTGVMRGCANLGPIVSSSPTEQLWVAGVVADNQGTLENCANYGSIQISGVDVNTSVAGVCIFAKGTISNCVNEGAVNVTLDLTDNRVFYCGGVLGRGECRGKDASFTNCRNKGAVRVVREAQGPFSIQKCGVAGVVACVIDGDEAHHLVIRNCFNDAEISLIEDEHFLQQSGCFAVGGIVGRVCPNGGKESYMNVAQEGYSLEIIGCRNAGNIEHFPSLRFPVYFSQRSPSGARFAYTGGIVGVLYGSSVSNALIESCINTGSISCGSRKASDVSGGIAGGIGNVQMRSCMSTATFSPVESVYGKAETIGIIGAAVGLVFKDSKIESCQAKAALETGTAKVYSKGFVGAVAIDNNADVEACSAVGVPAWGKILPGTLNGEIKIN